MADHPRFPGPDDTPDVVNLGFIPPFQATRGPVVYRLAEEDVPAALADPGPPCPRCGGVLIDHILVAGPNDDEYECIVTMADDVLADMEDCEPAAEEQWVTVVRALIEAYKVSLVTHEGPIVVTRGQHMADMAAITEDVVAEGGPLGSPTVFAVLRDIADHEPLVPVALDIRLNMHRCVMCGAEGQRTAYSPSGIVHLISCPWQRAVEIVGRGQDAPAPGGDRG